MYSVVEFIDLICKSCTNFKSIGWNLSILENMAQIGLLASVDLFGRPNFTKLQCGTVTGLVTLMSENFRTIGWAVWAGGEWTDRQTDRQIDRQTDKRRWSINLAKKKIPSNKAAYIGRERGSAGASAGWGLGQGVQITGNATSLCRL